MDSKDYPYIFYDRDVRSPVVIAYGSNDNYTYIGILSNSGALTQTGIYALQGDNINLINNVTTDISSKINYIYIKRIKIIIYNINRSF